MVQNYKQTDQRWAMMRIGQGAMTMYEGGCGICAIADVVGRTPDLVGSWMENKGYIYSDQGTVHGAIVPTLQHFGSDGEMITPGYVNGQMRPAQFQQVYDSVAAGFAAILLMGGTQTRAGGACRTDYWSYKGHYICIGGAKDGELLACDPYHAPRDGWHSIVDYTGTRIDSYNGNVKKIWTTKTRWKSDDTYFTFVLPQIGVNSTGVYVRLWQRLLKGIGMYTGKVDGSFGPVTVKATYAFQKLRGLKMDCIVGPATWSAAIPVAVKIQDSLASFTVRQIEYRYKGAEAYLWQNLLAADGYFEGSVDQTFGDGCRAATLRYQKDKGLEADCKVGPKTWKAAIGV